jgi:hypothetical protein
MENKYFQIRLLEAALSQKLSQLAGKYSDELVMRVWNEMRSGIGIEAYLSGCEWKAQMTLREALGYLEDYCDFIEGMIRKHLGKERGADCIPALYNQALAGFSAKTSLLWLP